MMSNVFVKRQQEWELKQHQDRIQNMKPCVDSKLGHVRITKRPARVRINKDKLRQIEQQNYRLLMRLRHIHMHYSLYMPRKSVYLQRGDAGRSVHRVKESAKKPEKAEETTYCPTVAPMFPGDHFVNGELANQVAGIKLRTKYRRQKMK